jgi:hypothetical protein
MIVDPLTSTIIGGVFQLSGAVAVFIIMSRQGRPKTPDPKKHLIVHHISGFSFSLSLPEMVVSMVAKPSLN